MREIVGFAREKMYFGYEDLVYKLHTFPIDWVKGIDFVEPEYRELFLAEYRQMCDVFEKEIEKIET